MLIDDNAANLKLARVVLRGEGFDTAMLTALGE